MGHLLQNMCERRTEIILERFEVKTGENCLKIVQLSFSGGGLGSVHVGASDRPKIWGNAQNTLKVFWGVFPTQNEPETCLQRCHTTKIEVSIKSVFKIQENPLNFWHSATLFWHSADTQLLFNTVPPKMALESPLRVLWHFWRYVQCFSEFSESTGMCFEAFWKRSGDFFEASKKSLVNFEICGNYY